MAKDKLAKKEKSLPLVQQKPRCPFYGFSSVGEVLSDSSGNQCALIREAHSPCYMEMERQNPDWGQCRYNSPEIKSCMKNLASGRVFSNELRPEGATSWEGISFSEHYEQVMGRPLS